MNTHGEQLEHINCKLCGKFANIIKYDRFELCGQCKKDIFNIVLEHKEEIHWVYVSKEAQATGRSLAAENARLDSNYRLARKLIRAKGLLPELTKTLKRGYL